MGLRDKFKPLHKRREFACGFVLVENHILFSWTQARSHRDAFGGMPPKFCSAQRICFKHLIKTKSLAPPKTHFSPPNLKTWLLACMTLSMRSFFHRKNRSVACLCFTLLQKSHVFVKSVYWVSRIEKSWNSFGKLAINAFAVQKCYIIFSLKTTILPTLKNIWMPSAIFCLLLVITG